MNRRHFAVAAVLSSVPLGACARENLQDTLLAQHLGERIKLIDSPGGVVIQSSTFILAERMHHWKQAQDIRAESPRIQMSTATNLLSVGSTSRPVELRHSGLPTGLKIYRASEAELKAIFDTSSLTSAWEQFRSKFQKATHLVRFSNVGFNETKDQAAFILSTACGGLCGSGQLVLMKRTATAWGTQESTNLWRS